MTVGDGLAAADVGAVAVAGAAAGLLEEVPALVWAAWACAAREPVGWAAWACAAREPAKVSSVTLTAATTHTATAVAAIATPGLARMLSQLTRLIACENLREPYRFRAPDYPPAIRHRILSGGGTAAQDLLPQFRRQRGQRQQAEKRRRAQRAPSVMGAGLALLDVPADQVARLLGQLPIPVGQQLPQHRAGLPSGKRDVQRTEGFLQPTAGA